MAKKGLSRGTAGSGSRRPKPKPGVPPALWAFGAGGAVLAGWVIYRLSQAVQPEALPEEEELLDKTEAVESDRMDLVREALFPAGGRGEAGVAKSRFGDAGYWDERYAQMRSDTFDWYGTWSSDSSPNAIQLKQYVLPLLQAPVKRVLNIGCGNSKLSEELIADGFSDVVGIDISGKVIESMSSKFAGKAGMSFLHMDATNMTFEEASFDLIFEKGTLDAMYTASRDLVAQTISEVGRVLRPGGLFVSVSFGAKDNRGELNSTVWEKHHTFQLKKGAIGGTGSLFLYAKHKAAVAR